MSGFFVGFVVGLVVQGGGVGLVVGFVVGFVVGSITGIQGLTVPGFSGALVGFGGLFSVVGLQGLDGHFCAPFLGFSSGFLAPVSVATGLVGVELGALPSPPLGSAGLAPPPPAPDGVGEPGRTWPPGFWGPGDA